VFESEQEYHDELSRLNVELDSCRSEASQHEAVLNSLRLSTDEKISRLQEDKAVLQVSVSVCGLCFMSLKRAITIIAIRLRFDFDSTAT